MDCEKDKNGKFERGYLKSNHRKVTGFGLSQDAKRPIAIFGTAAYKHDVLQKTRRFPGGRLEKNFSRHYFTEKTVNGFRRKKPMLQLTNLLRTET